MLVVCTMILTVCVQVYNAVRWGVDMSKFPTISRLNEELSKLPAFQQAHADAQPDKS